MKILSIRPKKNAVTTYRQTRPLKKWATFRQSLLRKNDKVRLDKLAERFKKIAPIWQVKYLEDPHTADVLVSMRNHCKAKLVVDFDDNIWQTPVGNIVRMTETFNKAVAVCTGLAQCADWITVSTEPLKQALKNLNENIVVLPNLIDPSEWKYKRKKHDKIRIGWIWSPTHFPDVPVVKEAIEEVVKNNDVELVLLGAKHNFLDCPATLIQGVPYAEYPKMLTELGIDISICPLADNDFNKCKSNIKWLESTLAGAAVVASKVYPYEYSIEHGTTGYLASNKNQWIKHITNLIKNTDLRENLVKNAKMVVLEKYDYNKNNQWQEFYESLK